MPGWSGAVLGTLGPAQSTIGGGDGVADGYETPIGAGEADWLRLQSGDCPPF